MRKEDNPIVPVDIRKYVKFLAKRLNPQAILLFGSVARGEAHRGSDYDLFVIADDLPDDFWERTKILWENKPYDVEVIGFRPHEIEKNIQRGLILDALLTGIPLYGDATNLKRKARKYISEKNLVKTPYGYFKKCKD